MGLPARSLWQGAVAGAAGVAVMTAGEKLEQVLGAPPWTWPRRELAVDLLHKTVYGFTTGAVADLLAARSGAGPGQRHAALAPGRRHDVGPLPRVAS